MHTRFIPRLLVLSLLFAFVFGAAIQFRQAAAADYIRWNDTVNVEDALVQACAGFNVTGSYTADRAIQVVQNYDGSSFYERRDVSFTGTLGNATSGKSYAYDGAFTHTASPNLGKATISDLSLRFGVGTPGEFSISLKRVAFDLGDDPHAIVKAIVPSVLQMNLCQLFGGSTLGSDQIKGTYPSPIDTENSTPNEPVAPYDERSVSNPPPNVQIESSALPQTATEVDDNMTPWTELDPCDTSPPGDGC